MPTRLLAGLVVAAAAASASAACPTLLDHKLRALDGSTVDLCRFQGQPLLIVNTASRCGYTPQFAKLEALYRDYQGRGLVVIGFPSNDFHQELDSNDAVGQFCRTVYGVQFPMMEKGAVSGDAAPPLYRQLAAAAGQAPRWNFHKYLVAPDGRTVHSFATKVEPDSPEILRVLQPMLRP